MFPATNSAAGHMMLLSAFGLPTQAHMQLLSWSLDIEFILHHYSRG